MPTVGFISDLHLAEEQPERITLFLRFLENYKTQLDQLYILGDLFEVWLGDDLITPSINTLIQALKQASTILPIKIIHGNRDFLMGEQFENLSGCQIVNEPQIIKLEEERALLMHGDLLCTDDHEYLQMRNQLRSAAWMKSFLSKPVKERELAAIELRQKSKWQSRIKIAQLWMRIMMRFLNTWSITKFCYLFMGIHTKLPFITTSFQLEKWRTVMFLMNGMMIMGRY